MPLGTHKATLFGVAGVSTGGDVVLLSTQTASDSSSLDFTSGITSTYGEYIFKFYNINPATDSQEFKFQFNAAGGSGFNEAITSTYFRAYNSESTYGQALGYLTSRDQVDADVAYQPFTGGVGSGADESCAGELHLFNPSSTTYVKHFYARTSQYDNGDYAFDNYTAGYINTTSAIDEISFKTSSGNFDGTIRMWGVKN
jgi:hypothetical protein